MGGCLCHCCHIETFPSRKQERPCERIVLGPDQHFYTPAPGTCAGSLQTMMSLVSCSFIGFVRRGGKIGRRIGWNEKQLLLAFEALLPVRFPVKASPPQHPRALL